MNFYVGMNLKYKNIKSNVVFPVVFMVRRFLFVSMAISPTVTDSYQPFVQAVIFILTQFCICLYLLWVKPFESRIKNGVEAANEFFVLIQSYFVLIYTGVVHDLNHLAYIGLYLIGLFYV